MPLRLMIAMLVVLTACNREPVTEIASPAGPGAAEPFLFGARDGSLLLSWIENGAVRMARYDDGSWSAPSTIVARKDLFVNWADFPSLVEMTDGTLLAHWLQKSGKGTYAYDVRMARSRDGGATWSESALLHDDGTQTEHGFVSLVPDASRPLVHALWLDGRNMERGGDMTLRYATVASDGTIASPAELDRRTCECCTTAMATTRGGLVAAYRDRSGDETRDISVVRKGSAGWTAPALLHRDGWKIAGCPVNGPQLDSRGDEVVAAWFTRDRVHVAFSQNGGATFSAPVRIDQAAPTGRVDVLMLPDGDALVTWIDGVGDQTAIVARRVPRSGDPGPLFTIARSSTARGSGFPRMARAGDDIWVAWTELEPQKRIRIARVRQ